MSLETISDIARVSATANSFVATTDKYRSMFSKGCPNSRVIFAGTGKLCLLPSAEKVSI